MSSVRIAIFYLVIIIAFMNKSCLAMEGFNLEDKAFNESRLINPALINYYTKSFKGTSYNTKLNFTEHDIGDYTKKLEKMIVSGGSFFHDSQKQDTSMNKLNILGLENALDTWKNLLAFFYCSSLIENTEKNDIGPKIVDFHFHDNSNKVIYNTLIAPFITGDEENPYLMAKGKNKEETYGEFNYIQLKMIDGGKYNYTPHEFSYLYIVYNKNEGTIIVRPEDTQRSTSVTSINNIKNTLYYCYTGIKNQIRDTTVGDLLEIRSNQDPTYKKSSIILENIEKSFRENYPKNKETKALKEILTVLKNDKIDPNSNKEKAKLFNLIHHTYQEPEIQFGNEIVISNNSIYGLLSYYYHLAEKAQNKAKNFFNAIKPFVRFHRLISLFNARPNTEDLTIADIRTFVQKQLLLSYKFKGSYSDYLNTIILYLDFCIKNNLDISLCDFRIFHQEYQKNILDELKVPKVSEKEIELTEIDTENDAFIVDTENKTITLQSNSSDEENNNNQTENNNNDQE